MIDATMSNRELEAAIQETWSLLYRTHPDRDHYQATVDHYKALLKEQERRAIERDAKS